VLLSLLAGVSRTAFAMASNGDLPRFLAAVHPRARVPHRAVIIAGGIVAVVAAVADVRSAIGFSSFAVLVYYAIANAAACTLARDERRWLRWLARLGLLGCAVLALSLPLVSLASGVGLLAIGAGSYRALRGRSAG
jgi:APA family basic amino acid/polyamine antiporter